MPAFLRQISPARCPGSAGKRGVSDSRRLSLQVVRRADLPYRNLVRCRFDTGLSLSAGNPMILSFAVLTSALLFGGMTLYSFGFAAFLFTALPAETAGKALRRAFPWFYLFVIVTALTTSALLWSHDSLAGVVMALVAITTVPVRQMLMPAINRATDSGQRQRFKWLHGLSVVVTLCHIAAAGFVLVRQV